MDAANSVFPSLRGKNYRTYPLFPFHWVLLYLYESSQNRRSPWIGSNWIFPSAHQHTYVEWNP